MSVRPLVGKGSLIFANEILRCTYPTNTVNDIMRNVFTICERKMKFQNDPAVANASRVKI